MKRFLHMLFPVLLVFLSCKKMDNIVPNNYQNDTQQTAVIAREPATAAVVTIPQTPIVNVDTIPPADAVSVKNYNAKGNGLIDDSNALQNAINSANNLFLPAGTYIISKTLNMRAGVKIYGTKGSIIKAGLLMNGTLLSMGRFFKLQNDDDCAFINLEFQSARAFKPGEWANACIYVQDSKNTNISYNNFNFSLPYAKNGVDAIWVTGDQSENTIIKGNKLSSAGIEYAEAGASGSIVDGNTIDHAPSDAISAHGNSDSFCTKNVVMNNIITNPGMMGIEDWGNMDGTVIKNNTVTSCGKDPAQHGDGMGISAVGVNGFVVNNTITDAVSYYIECNRNITVDGNTINDTKGQAVGIIGNYRAADATGRWLSNTHNITNNIITGCSFAIYIFGDYATSDINIASNTIKNPFGVGISIDSSTPAFHMMVTDNNISFTVPNKGSERSGCLTYTTQSQRTADQVVTFNNNTITYATTAAGGKGIEKGICVASDNTVLNGNKVYGNSIKAGGSAVFGITSNFDASKNITLTSNTVQGASVVLGDFSIKLSSENNF